MPLLLFTASYPFGTGETFLEAEVPVLARHVGKIIIVPETTAPTCRPVPEGVEVVPAPPSLRGGVWQVLKALASPQVWAELRRLPVSVPYWKVALRAWADSERWAAWITMRFGHLPDLVLYTYWCDVKTVALARLRQQHPSWKCITRLHGWDVYQHRHQLPYLPFRPLIGTETDALVFIAKDGQDYFRRTWPTVPADKLHLFRLGTRRPVALNPEPEAPPLIVSCSNLIPLKRVHLIAEAVQALGGRVRWAHFGDGPEEEALRQYIARHQMEGYAALRGRVSNEVLHSFYATHPVGLLVNVSTSEGLPVSVMEAFSYGIPVMATAVGGTPEIVQDGHNGWLLPADITAPQLVQKITHWLAQSPSEQRAMRQAARQTWEQDYQADINFEAFARRIEG